MPKATLTFDLPEEQEEFRLAQNGCKYYNVLWDIDIWLRSEIEYKDRVEFQEVRDKLYKTMQDEGVSLD